ncbi:Ribosomal RNA small subunit methyltransferase G [Candidatus Filomicrobium marinum]|uniref:Ribosomal RNA small subunit methyltransferase G n=1 Tax=Candidatus Filomicrobium marinum TaxID=1608628 RepID=A0A0D6JCL7_9HYPH|nr:16S rRNA (guanine(527)-N(7))-methyltransferase RsmG [Candidatus Filomicrobium marinum]CFX09629.1 Ribosomal RNA small subunit methyltransferase G [Candidatus Filomicrobium marinum]CPR16992.1 Ribosomal RNA small subunit methyltransferase G [Candidatus Filomicrobium marinum]
MTPNDMSSINISGPEEFIEYFDISRETLELLDLYANTLQHWQKTINLVAPSTLDSVWQRHFADSAQLLKLAPENVTSWVDLGSGAGFPGLVIAILIHGKRGAEAGSVVRLIESDARKAAFLGEIARRTSVAVDIVPRRIELSSTQANFEPVEVVTARALAPLERLLGLAYRFFNDGTIGLFPKGRDVEREIEAARKDWQFDVRLEQSLTDPEGRIAVIEHLKAKSKG